MSVPEPPPSPATVLGAFVDCPPARPPSLQGGCCSTHSYQGHLVPRRWWGSPEERTLLCNSTMPPLTALQPSPPGLNLFQSLLVAGSPAWDRKEGKCQLSGHF